MFNYIHFTTFFKYLLIIFIIFYNVNLKSEWTKVYKSDYSFDAYGIDCADEQNCMCITSAKAEGTIFYKSTDGGTNWFVSFADTITKIYDNDGNLIETKYPILSQPACIDYVTENFAVAGYNYGIISITRDGGKSWDSLRLNSSLIINLIQFQDSLKGVAASFDKVFRTFDGGVNWEDVTSIIFDAGDYHGILEFNSLAVIDNHIYLGGYFNYSGRSHTIFKSSDFGNSWEIIDSIFSDEKALQTDLFFINSMDGWFCGFGSAPDVSKFSHFVYHTDNGGITWELQLDTIPKTLYVMSGIYFEDNKKGIIWGDGTESWRTSDGGKTWLSDSSKGNILNLRYCVFPNKTIDKIISLTWRFPEIWLYNTPLNVYDDIDELWNINFYPNPAIDYIEIGKNNKGLNPFTEIEKVQLIDLFGIEVPPAGLGVTGTDGSDFRIDISHLPAGVYFIRIGCRVEKFVKI